MRKWRFSCLLLISMLSVTVLAQQVNVDWQRGNNFAQYTTYAWAPSPHPIQDSLWNQRIIDAIDTQLLQKGLQKVSPDANPSLVVVYNAGIRQNVSLEGYSMGGWYNRTATIQQVVERDGTLIVDLADPKTKMVVWRGVAQETLSDKSSKNIEKLQKMVKKLFAKYPPQG
jgi:hypothetical protein